MSEQPAFPDGRAPATDAEALRLLREGTIDLAGRLLDASNITLIGTVRAGDVVGECVYKPVKGERPLWDFPDGTLAGREISAFLISEATGWRIVPPTVLRDGPFGSGMVQLWVDTKDGDDLVDVLTPRDVPPGWRRVLRARDRFGEPAILTHADHPRVQLLAALDVVINNADRKGGHVLMGPDGRVYGCDHGVSFHVEPKLRTVLWGWTGRVLPDESVDVLGKLLADLRGDLGATLKEHITGHELGRLRARIRKLLETACYPEPGGDWPAVPWPPM
jgi:uncharacterized repeat protein (TIGR03843 family)